MATQPASPSPGRGETAPRRAPTEWPLWLQLGVPYSTLVLIVCTVIALCFVIARLATGSAT